MLGNMTMDEWQWPKRVYIGGSNSREEIRKQEGDGGSRKKDNDKGEETEKVLLWNINGADNHRIAKRWRVKACEPIVACIV
jgi:hypothetical protein